MKEIMSYLVPVASIFISYFLGQLSIQKTRKIEVLKERYLGFYIPFIQKLYKNHYGSIDPNMMDLEERESYLQLISDNLHLLGRKSSHMLSDYYNADTAIAAAELDRSDDAKNSAEWYKYRFQALTKAILEEGSVLARKLKYPDISAELLTIYFPQSDHQQSSAHINKK